MGPPGRSMFIFIIIPKNATGRNKATQKTHTFCHNIKSAAGKSPPIGRGAVRKRRRETGDFAVSRRQSALTTTKGAGAAKPRRPRWGLRPAGRFAKRSGRTLVAPAGPAALFLVLPSKSPISWCGAVRVREAAKAPAGPWTGWAVCKAERAHLCCARSPRPRILDEESTKSGPASLGGLRGRSACFMHQNPTAEPPFSYATLAFTQFFTASACISPAGWPPGWQGPPRPARSRSRRGCPRRERARSCPTGWTRWWAP